VSHVCSNSCVVVVVVVVVCGHGDANVRDGRLAILFKGFIVALFLLPSYARSSSRRSFHCFKKGAKRPQRKGVKAPTGNNYGGAAITQPKKVVAMRHPRM
jgi:hypothetical protein